MKTFFPIIFMTILLVACGRTAEDAKKTSGLAPFIQGVSTPSKEQIALADELCYKLGEKRRDLSAALNGTAFNFRMNEVRCNGNEFGGTTDIRFVLLGDSYTQSRSGYRGTFYSTLETDKQGVFADLCGEVDSSGSFRNPVQITQVERRSFEFRRVNGAIQADILYGEKNNDDEYETFKESQLDVSTAADNDLRKGIILRRKEKTLCLTGGENNVLIQNKFIAQ